MCEYFCLGLTSEKFVCGCPNGMVLNETTQKCECLEGNKLCPLCEKHEFYCENHRCILQKYVCNGVDDCGDKSDESFCSKTCGEDETYCVKDKKCLKSELICNDKNDCSDGSDEYECERIIPRCGENSFECLNESCIPYDRVCDGNNDCWDDGDEKDCLRIKCEKLGSYCDDGQCIPESHVCDNIFHCTDFSDERACHSVIFFDRDFDCLISCDNECLPINKICDHITDCGDQSDELICSFRVTCPLYKPNFCEDGERCYSDREKCDGFQDCLDGSDEKHCAGNLPCFGEEFFTCDNLQKICMSKVCDGINDCYDESDEKFECNNGIYMTDVELEFLDKGIISFQWNIDGKVSEYNMFIYSTNQKIDRVKKTVHENEIVLGSHVQCERYILVIKVDGIVIRYKQYIYIQNFYYFTPYDLEFHSSDRILRWKTNCPSCFHPTFYVLNHLILDRMF
ncbi:Low-density lipoprotein receptor-related protein 2 [Thelohanellus kitauei]|uniref:Low-density lipoprotein receptor-related protein 2 n=1 Tax=Thelohanellus kitauei TaxID=669202 RepID=A0A0C2M477_THEKT|nr:Low-density lipoprotein receptor-related protein 2 [Thelohanellus kitauei]